jgi:hypothetical protein
MLKLVAILLCESDGGLKAVLPPTVEKEALLRREAEVALLPLAIFQDAEIFEEFADVFGLGTWDGNIVRGPGIGGDFVFAPASVASSLRIHFEQNEIGEAAFAQAPGSAQAGYAAADNYDRKFLDVLGGRKRRAVAQEMTHLKGIVDEGAGDGAVRFEGESDEGGTSSAEKLAAANLQ